MGLFFSSSRKARLYTGPIPTYFSVHSESADGKLKVEPTSLQSFIESRCPTLLRSYRPAWWLFSGHLQTAYCVTGDFSKVDKVVYNRKLLRLLDGGTLGLDFTPPGPQPVNEDAPIIVVLHGLTGGSHESYVRAILTPAITPKDEGGLGYRGVVVNFRGCAGVPITSSQLYSAGHTDDFRQAVLYISKMYPNAPLLGLGFSLGANVLVRYLAEEGERSRIRAGCALGCPWDLVKNSDRLENNWLLQQVYSKGMGSNLLNLVKRHLVSFSELQDNRLAPMIAEVLTLNKPTLFDFDSRMTRVAGGSSPPFPFPTARDYYTWASSDKCLRDVRVPLLAVNADDDPIVGCLPFDVGDNGLVALVVTRGGGHLGWFEAGGVWGTVRRWIAKPIVEWLRAVGEDLVSDRIHPLQWEEVDGWIREVGRDHLGYRELGDGGQVEGVQGEGGLLQGL